MKVTALLFVVAVTALLVPSLQDPVHVSAATNATVDGVAVDLRSPPLVRHKRWVGTLFRGIGRLFLKAGTKAAKAARGFRSGVRDAGTMIWSPKAGYSATKAGLDAARNSLRSGDSLLTATRVGVGVGRKGLKLHRAISPSFKKVASKRLASVGRYVKKKTPGFMLNTAEHLALAAATRELFPPKQIVVREGPMQAPEQRASIVDGTTRKKTQVFWSTCYNSRNWIHLKSHGLCYLNLLPYESKTNNFYVALHKCEELDATLAMPKSIEENKKIKEVSDDSDKPLWLGISKYEESSKGSFTYQDGQPLVWTNFATKESDSFKHCVEMTSGGKWKSAACHHRKNSVCQMPDHRFFDVFGTGGYDWLLAFRGTSGINQSVYGSFTERQKENVVQECRQVGVPGKHCQQHYANNAVLHGWAYIARVAFVIYKDDKRVAHFIFDGTGSNNKNWFSHDRIIESSFHDIGRTSPMGPTVVSSSVGNGRRSSFFMNKHHANDDDCNMNAGWFRVVDSDEKSVSCPWERNSVKERFPAFLYAKNNMSANWNSDNVGVADTFAIFVQYIQETKDPST